MSERVRYVRVGPGERARYQERIAGLERLATYPIGDDFFQLDHGPDYFAFFDRLGKVEYWAVLAGDEVVAVGAGVLREVPFVQGGRPRRTWYACDLKVHPEHRGRHLPLALLRRSFPRNYLRCARGYGISMNPAEGPNPVVRLLGRWRWTPIRPAATLRITSLDADAMAAAAPIVREHRGPIRYLSLARVKDVVLRSTGAPMPLLHVQWGPGATGLEEPRPEHVHMLCAPEGDPLDRALSARGFRASATATVVQHRMGDSDWRFVLTSSI